MNGARLLLAAALVCGVSLFGVLGCQAPSPPEDPADDTGNLEPLPPEDPADDTGKLAPFPQFDWDAALAQLPKAGFGDDHEEFKAFNDAVGALVEQAYGVENAWIHNRLVEPVAEPETQDDRYKYGWYAFLDGVPEKLGDPWRASDTMLELDITVDPASGEYLAYAPSDDVTVDETLKWDFPADDPLKDAQARVPEIRSRILRAVFDAYLRTTQTFWAGFEVVRSLVHDGVLAGGRYSFPGSHGANLCLSMGWYHAYGIPDAYHVLYTVSVDPPDEVSPEPVPEWSDLVQQLPPPGFDELWRYKKATLEAFQRFCAADARVSVNDVIAPSEPGWKTLGLTWFRAPTGEKPRDYRFESSDLEILPGASPDGPLAQRAIITDVVAWGEQASGGARTPAIQALVPVRATTLQAYLPLDNTFTEQLGSLELSNGLETDLTGLQGFTVHLKVEEVSQEEGLWRCRYSLTWTAETSSGD